ncbi:MAG: ribonuclease PH, partial [Bdellovibrionales bacterium]|nr:ribonuclease PH [Bdellovibrionales bacterium]
TGGRTQEISRLIGRSLRAAVDLKALGERQIQIDCDVLQADGGTRTAAITGGFVALALGLRFLQKAGQLATLPLKNYVSAISVGLTPDGVLLDLDYEEDFACGADVNFVMTDSHQWVEVQGTSEGQNFTTEQLLSMMKMAEDGCMELFKEQQKYVGEFFALKA